jgi:hypothetical protein
LQKDEIGKLTVIVNVPGYLILGLAGDGIEEPKVHYV